jgi:hypothetical protein
VGARWRVLDAALEADEVGAVVVAALGEPELAEVLFEARRQARIHGGAAREDDVVVELLARVDVGLVDAVEELLGHAAAVDVDERRLEEALGGLEALLADADDATVGQLVGLDEHGGLVRELVLKLRVVGDVAELLLDHADGLKVGGAVEGVAAQQHQLDEVARDGAAGDVEAARQVRQREALEDGHGVRDAVARVDDDAGQQALRVERQHGLDGDVDRLEAVLLEHDLAEALAVLLRVHRRLGEQDLALARVDAQLLVERVVPHVLDVLPVAHDAVLERIRDLQHHAQLRRLVAHHDVLDFDVVDLLLEAQNRPAHHRREDGRRKVGAGEAALDKARLRSTEGRKKNQ